MRFRLFTAMVAALAAAVSVHAAEKDKKQAKVEPARGSVVGNVICSKCALNATEKCQTALLLATTYAQWGIVASDGKQFLTANERLGKARKLSRDKKYASSQLANKLGRKQFVLLSGKAGESLFHSRCSGKLVRVSGVVTVKDGVATITGKKSTEVKNKHATPGLTLAGKLVCSKCDFKIGKCAAALKAGDLQVLLEGDAAKALFKARCSGQPKVATGALTKIEGNTVSLKVSKIVDPKTTPTVWQPMLAKSFKANTKDLRVSGLVVDRKVGCVFLSVEGKGVYCSAFGANRFKPNKKTWEQVCKLRTEDSKHKFVLTDRGIKESSDGGATWSQPLPLPKGFVRTAQTWIAYDAKHDNLYLMKSGSDLYKLERGK